MYGLVKPLGLVRPDVGTDSPLLRRGQAGADVSRLRQRSRLAAILGTTALLWNQDLWAMSRKLALAAVLLGTIAGFGFLLERRKIASASSVAPGPV